MKFMCRKDRMLNGNLAKTYIKHPYAFDFRWCNISSMAEEEKHILTLQGDCYGLQRQAKPGEARTGPFTPKTNFRVRLISFVASPDWPMQKFECEVTLKERLMAPRQVYDI